KNQQALPSALSASSLRYQMPATLEKSIRTSIRKTARVEAAPFVVPWRLFAIAASVAAVLVGAVAIWTLLRALPGSTQDGVLAQEVVSSHIRSLMSDHLEDVASTD